VKKVSNIRVLKKLVYRFATGGFSDMVQLHGVTY
jgi:hypothetical protein